MISKLMELGLSEYESRAYISLLETNPVTAYEAAKNAGIPTSKIYEVLDRLEARGIVQTHEEDTKKKFIPLDAEQFLETQNVRLKTTIAELGTELAQLGKSPEVSLVWNIRDYRALIDYLKTAIDSSTGNFLLSIWPEDLPVLEDSLAEAKKRGVKIATVCFGKIKTDASSQQRIPGQLFTHPIEDTLYSEKGGRGITAVSDGRQALVATISPENSVEGAWSRNAGFVTLAEDYIKHDIYIMKIVERFDDALIRKFGSGYHRLRDIFSDTQEEQA